MTDVYVPPVHASLVAKWFVRRAAEDLEQDLDPLKLQKLIYLAHSRYLFECHSPLVVEPTLAWTHGPVVRTVYNEYCEFENRPISVELAEGGPWARLDSSVVSTLDATWNSFAAYSSWHLREMTHAVGPYEAFFVEHENVVIPNDLIASAWPEFARLAAAPVRHNASAMSQVLARYSRVRVPSQERGSAEAIATQVDRSEDSIKEAESHYR